LGSTDAKGRVAFEAPEPPYTLVVSGENIRTRECFVAVATPLVRIVVIDGASASGRVLLAGSSEPPPPRTIVFAWPRDWRFTPRDFAQRVRTSDPRLALAWTDADGHFDLFGLPTEVPYFVSAAAPGWCDWPPTALLPGEENVVLMECILGVRVIVQERGGHLPGPLRSYGRPVAAQHFSGSDAAYLLSPNPVSELLGAGRAPSSGDPTRAEYLFACGRAREVLGPIPFQLDVPGTVSEVVDVWARPTDHGIYEVVLEAVPTPEARRDIELEFVGVPEKARSRLAVRAPVALVSLSSASGTLFADVDDFSQPLVLESVPVSLQLTSVTTNVGEPGEVRCERTSIDGGSERWRVDFGSCQALEIELMLPDGTLYRGPAVVLLGRSEETLGTPVVFDRAPYVLLSPSPADAHVLVLSPAGESVAPFEAAPVRRFAIAWQ
jgi:hypothetical protein